MVDGDARYEPDQSEAEDVRRGVEADASIIAYEQEISEPDRGGKWRSLNFAPGKMARGILMFMSQTHPRSTTRSGGGMSF